MHRCRCLTERMKTVRREAASVNIEAAPTSKTSTATQAREPASYKYSSVNGTSHGWHDTAHPLTSAYRPHAECADRPRTRSHAAFAQLPPRPSEVRLSKGRIEGCRQGWLETAAQSICHGCVHSPRICRSFALPRQKPMRLWCCGIPSYPP